MKLGFNFEMDSNNRRDRRILRDWLNNMARLAPMFGDMVERLVPGGFGLGEPVGTVHPFPPSPDLHEVPPVSSEAVVRGRDALRALVAAWREAQKWGTDFAPALSGSFSNDGGDILAYVQSVGALVPAIAAVWGEPGVAMSPEQAAETMDGAKAAAGYFVSVASALGFQVPSSWYASEVK